MRKRSTFGWLELLIGGLLIALGILSFVRPGRALISFVLLYGIIAILLGVADIIFYIKLEQYTGVGPVIALASGIISVLAGVMILTHPGAGELAMTVLFPLWFMSHCISRLMHQSFIRVRLSKGLYYFTFVANVIGLVLAFLMLFEPWLAYFSLNTFIGVYLILLGIDSIVLAFSSIGEW